MKTFRWTYMLLALVLVLSLGLAACGGDEDGGDEATPVVTVEPTEEMDVEAEATEAMDEMEAEGTEEAAADGEALFVANCQGCHAIDSDETIVGPSLQNIADEAGDRVDDLSAEEYIHQSIVEPNAYIAEGFDEGAMPAFDQLADSEVDAIVDYLMTHAS